MDDNRHFRLLWRINAVLIPVVILLAIGQSVYYKLRGRFYVTDVMSNEVTFGVDELGETALKEKWRYGKPGKVLLPSSDRYGHQQALPLLSLQGEPAPPGQFQR